MKGVAIVVQRVESHQKPDTDEIEYLTRSAGYEVAEVLTQSREKDREYNVGQGKVHEVNIAAKERNADIIVVDNEMGPYQLYNFGIYVPNEVDVLDRYSLILDIFEQRSNTKKSQLQVELARLRHELPRAETKVRLAKRKEKPGFMGLGEYDKSRVRAIKKRIKSIRDELGKAEKDNQKRREQRRKQGFDLVAIAGYTNAGKSTLLRRLAENHSVGENEEIHKDMSKTAESAEKYFTTLDTTTRRMDFDKRDVLLTDTVGFIDNLPDWLVDAFAATFDSIYRADLVLLVVDATNDIDNMMDRIATCHDIISRRDAGRVITVFNKTDKVEEDELRFKRQQLSHLAPNPVMLSAKKGDNIGKLKERVHKSLPPFMEDTLLLPLRDETMSLISWVHDNANVHDCTYTDTNVIVEYEGRKDVIQKAKSKAGNLVEKD